MTSDMPPSQTPSRTAVILMQLASCYSKLWHGLRVFGTENIPAQGPIILAANHTTAIDPLLMQTGCSHRLITWVMLRQHHIKPLNFVWNAIHPIALDKDSSDLKKLRELLRRLSAGDAIGMFPEGKLQREHRTLADFEHGVSMLAHRSGALIVPVWIAGTPCKHAMAWHFLSPSRSTVTFGQPFKALPQQSLQETTAELRKRMLALANQTAQVQASQNVPSVA